MGSGTGFFGACWSNFAPTPVTLCHGEFPFLRLPSSSRRGLVIAMVASLIFIVLLRFLAGIMVWVMIVLVILVLGYGERCPRRSGAFSVLSLFSFPYLKQGLHAEPPQAESLDPNIGGVGQHLALCC